MSDCIKLNKGNIDVCERGYVSSEDFENALDAYGVISERVDELDQLGFEFRWSSVPDAGIDENDGLEWIEDDNPPRERGFDIAC